MIAVPVPPDPSVRPCPSRRRRAIAVALGTACVLAFTAAAFAQEWRYQVRPGDTLWNLSERFLDGRASVERLRRHNQVGEPRRLARGSVVRIPLSWMRRVAAAASLASLRGEVMVESAGNWTSATAGQALRENDRLRTQADAHAALRLPDGSEVRVLADSEVVVETLAEYANANVYDSRLLVVRGRTETMAPPARDAATRFDLRTRAGVTSVRGTEFRVASGADETGRTEVLRGTVAAFNDAGSVTVAAGYGTAMVPGRAPSPPAPLLPPPRLAVVPSPDPRRAAGLAVTPVAGAAAYRLQIADDDRFSPLVLERTGTEPVFSFEGLAIGVYVLRVRAIDADGLEGRDAQMRIRVSPRPQSDPAGPPADASRPPA